MTENITWVGMDAHKKSIHVALKKSGRKKLVVWITPNTTKAVRQLARKMVKFADGTEVRCCYEAGPCGFVLQRQLHAAAPLVCEVIAPSLIPKRPGDRVKTDRRDAAQLVRLHAAGLLTEVIAPTEAEEAVRDLCRCRDDVRQDRVRARHRLSKFAARHGFVYTRTPWTQGHHRWLRALQWDDRQAQVVFDHYLCVLEHLNERMRHIVSELERVSEEVPYREAVGVLRAFHGIDTITAMTLLSELHGFARFESPRALMSYLGLTPSEYSSGGKEKRGAITKAGNAHVRRVLVESAQHYRRRPGGGVGIRKRREGQPAEVVAIAEHAEQRLHRRYRRLTERGKPPNKAIVAVARELVGFIWSALQSPHLQAVHAECTEEVAA